MGSLFFPHPLFDEISCMSNKCRLFIMSKRRTFSSEMSRSEISTLADANKDLVSRKWLNNALQYFGAAEVPGSKSDPLIVQFIATTTGNKYQARTSAGTFMEVSAASRLPLVCSIGFDFNRTTKRGRKGKHLSEKTMHWCSAFVNHVMISSGYTGTHSLAARSWQHWGRNIKKRDRKNYFGAIAVFTRPSKKNPNAGHVGFYVGETKYSYLILGGNQSDSVCVKKYRKSRLLKFRWPD